jgi:hypothetical protein
MSYNLLRNARVFFTTNVDINTGAITTAATNNTADTIQEIQVLDGFSFSQNTSSETVTLNESGPEPTRGQRQFNTALNPVDFSFTTYIRPADNNTPAVTLGRVTAEERVLWNAMFSATKIDNATGAGGAWSETAPVVASTGSSITTPSYAEVVVTNSQVHQLQKFGLIIVFEDTTFFIENCTLDTATIDFGLDAIATIAWTGKATRLIQPTTKITITDGPSTGAVTNSMSGGITAGSFRNKITAAPYIANKLSTMTLKSNINAATVATVASKTYTVPLTGGSIVFANNVSYLTPANLGIVNQPCTYFTGTRSITGTLNAYLRSGTGANYSATLLADMLKNSVTDVSPAFEIVLSIGGASNETRVDIDLPAVVLGIPTIATQQVMSTTINFTAQSYTASNTFDIALSNEVSLKYYSPTNIIIP